MKTKKEHIDFWIMQSKDDWDAVDSLFKGKNYLQSLFFAHLVIETQIERFRSIDLENVALH